MIRILTLALGVAAVAGAAKAQSATATPQPTGVSGTAPAFCAIGEVVGGTVIDLGVILDPVDGRLARDLAAPPKTVAGLICNARSVIQVNATPMAAQTAAGTPPPGFTAQVDYVAQISGWTQAPAVFATQAASNPAAQQSRSTPHFGEVSVQLDGFAVRGGDELRPVADEAYRGEITVTLSVAD